MKDITHVFSLSFVNCKYVSAVWVTDIVYHHIISTNIHLRYLHFWHKNDKLRAEFRQTTNTTVFVTTGRKPPLVNCLYKRESSDKRETRQPYLSLMTINPSCLGHLYTVTDTII